MKIAIKVCNWIGDVVMNVPAIDFLKQRYPQAEIVVIARPWVAQVLRFRPELVDRVIRFDDKKTSSRQLFGFARRLRAERFDLSVVFSKHIKGVIPPFLARIPRRLGFANAETRLFINGGMPFRRLPSSGRHQSLNYLDLIARGLAVPVPRQAIAPRLVADPQLEQRVRQTFLRDMPLPLLVVHAGAAYGTAKRWLPERFAEVCRQFIGRHHGTVVLLGVSSEHEVNEHIGSTLDKVHFRNLVGKTNLEESLALIGASQVFLSNDSGLMHVAAAFQKPQVAVFGPTDVKATFPFNPAAETVFHRVPCSPCFKRHCPIGHDCMVGVTTKAVGQALDAVFPIGPTSESGN